MRDFELETTNFIERPVDQEELLSADDARERMGHYPGLWKRNRPWIIQHFAALWFGASMASLAGLGLWWWLMASSADF